MLKITAQQLKLHLKKIYSGHRLEKVTQIMKNRLQCNTYYISATVLGARQLSTTTYTLIYTKCTYKVW